MKPKSKPHIGLIVSVILASLLANGITYAQSENTDIVSLPRMSVYSQRVALQEPSAGAFAMPVSALGFEPLVDVQARNMGEAQADVTLRGGIFENTGFRIGAAPLHDSQTGHYLAEIPIAPAMLSAPGILTGADNALNGWNANAGTVAYQWQPIRTMAMLTAAAGGYGTTRGEIYQGWVAPGKIFAFDVDAAFARSNGSLPWGESRFSRGNIRVQLQNAAGSAHTRQTDLFLGQQTKFIGWPNLYTPYPNIFETDDLLTTVVALNHRQNLNAATGTAGDFFSIGGAWRRNVDTYVFNRPDAGAFNPAFPTSAACHTTRAWSAGAQARASTGEIHWNVAADFVADRLESTSLIHGRFNTRSYFKAALAPERAWAFANGRALTARAGMVFDATNRDGSAWSPVASLSLDNALKPAGIETVYISHAASSQVPTYMALNSNASAGLFRGNPNLGRERARNFEIGACGAWGAWTANAAVFYRRDNDLVDWVYSSQFPNARAANPVNMNTFGIEMVARFSSRRADFVLGYTALSKDADYAPASAGGVDASFYALNYARHRATAAIMLRPARGWEIRLDNEARLQAANALRRSGDKALLTSAGLFFSPARSYPHPGATFFAQVANVWNSNFEQVPAVPAARRQWSAGMMVAW